MANIDRKLAWKSLVIAVVLVSAISASAAGCTKLTEPYRDAPRGVQNTGSADTITMPDGFSNVATKCDHGNRIYVVYHGDNVYAAIAVVSQDPTCEN